MIITKVLGLTSAFAKNKKAKIAILGIEMAVLAYAAIKNKKEKKPKQLNS